MQENTLEQKAKPKRSRFLTVLLVLTSISLVSVFIGDVLPLFSGPKSDETLDQEQVELAKTKMLMLEYVDDEESKQAVHDSFEFAERRTRFIHTKAFLIYHLVHLITFGLGVAGVYLMFQLNKIGFHLYIIYCLLKVGSVYIVFPSELIIGSSVITELLLSGVFVFLYSRNLKDFDKHSDYDASEYEYSN